MWTGVFLGVLALAACGGADDCKCSKSIQKYYTELNCRPIKEGGACCPTKFDCGTSLSVHDPEKCHLKGKVFEPKAVISSEQAGSPCVPECRCLKFGKQANLMCVHVDCPENLGGRLEENCVRLYEHDRCCSTGTHCTNTNGSAAKESKTCQYDGKSYVFGQKFYPKEEPCKQCICQQGFDGTLNGPWCKEVNCGIELHYGTKILDGCAPIHFGINGCCPIGWRCPSASDTVVPAAAKKRTATASKCSFGKLSLNVGDKLSKEKQCVECQCSVPPHVTCVQRGYC